jgi:hypothetical protein
MFMCLHCSEFGSSLVATWAKAASLALTLLGIEPTALTVTAVSPEVRFASCPWVLYVTAERGETLDPSGPVSRVGR